MGTTILIQHFKFDHEVKVVGMQIGQRYDQTTQYNQDNYYKEYINSVLLFN